MGAVMADIVPSKAIEEKIHEIRGQRVMSDMDLAEIHGVETRALNQAAIANQHRFPEDFMFRLAKEEMVRLRSQTVTSRWGGPRYPPRKAALARQPFAFGAAVCSSGSASIIV
jgi:hypothetical protein